MRYRSEEGNRLVHTLNGTAVAVGRFLITIMEKNGPGNPDAVTELDAIIAYLQILGRMVDFADYSTEDLIQ